MRSFFKLPGTVFVAVAALFAVVASTSTANAIMLRDTAPVATALTGPESVEKVAISRWAAWQARRDVARSLRSDCRVDGTRRENRRECFREAFSQMREMRQDAHAAGRNAYDQCRQGGGSRRYCRQIARQATRDYWVTQASGGGSDEPAGEPPRSDD